MMGSAIGLGHAAWTAPALPRMAAQGPSRAVVPGC